VRVWNIARTQDEIQVTMNRGLQGNETGLVGYWNFDDNTANDLTQYDNDGTLCGDTYFVESNLALGKPIPEPTTIFLMSCGLLGLLGIGIKQCRKKK